MKFASPLAVGISAFALTTVLSACGDQAAPGDAGSIPATTQSAPEAASTTGAGAVDEAHNDADTMFAQMMIVHHEGAIEMADLAVEQAGSEDVRALAEGISAAQGPEIETMTSWLEAWGEATRPMDGHDMGGHGGMEMHGMSQEEAMGDLEGLSGTEFDRRFLELMTAHHQGAVTMAEQLLESGENAQALDLAQTIIDDQQAEIAEMAQLLQQL